MTEEEKFKKAFELVSKLDAKGLKELFDSGINLIGDRWQTLYVKAHSGFTTHETPTLKILEILHDYKKKHLG